jgi:hypothetical protein
LYRIRAENDTASAWIVVSDLTPYGEWASGLDWQGLDSSAQGDANGDGFENLMAYSFGFNPLEEVPADAFPQLSGRQGVLQLTYHRNPNATDVVFEIQTTSDLMNPDWQELEIDGMFVTETDLGPVGDDRLIQVEISDTLLQSVEFFRLQVEREPPDP